MREAADDDALASPRTGFKTPPGQPFCREAATNTVSCDGDHENETRARVFEPTSFRKCQRCQRFSGNGDRVSWQIDPLAAAAKLLFRKDQSRVASQRHLPEAGAVWTFWMNKVQDAAPVHRPMLTWEGFFEGCGIKKP